MTITRLDTRIALIAIDLQNGMAALPFAHSFEAVVVRTAMLADALRQRGLPVVIVNTDGAAPGRREQAPGIPRTAGWTEIVDELRVEPSDHRINKRSPGAFTATGLDKWLYQQKVTHVVVAGVASGTGVDTTARQAYEPGLNVIFAIDAMTDMDPVVHDTCVERTFKRFGERGSTDALMRLIRCL